MDYKLCFSDKHERRGSFYLKEMGINLLIPSIDIMVNIL